MHFCTPLCDVILLLSSGKCAGKVVALSITTVGTQQSVTTTANKGKLLLFGKLNACVDFDL